MYHFRWVCGETFAVVGCIRIPDNIITDIPTFRLNYPTTKKYCSENLFINSLFVLYCARLSRYSSNQRIWTVKGILCIGIRAVQRIDFYIIFSNRSLSLYKLAAGSEYKIFVRSFVPNFCSILWK